MVMGSDPLIFFSLPPSLRTILLTPVPSVSVEAAWNGLTLYAMNDVSIGSVSPLASDVATCNSRSRFSSILRPRRCISLMYFERFSASMRRFVGLQVVPAGRANPPADAPGAENGAFSNAHGSALPTRMPRSLERTETGSSPTVSFLTMTPPRAPVVLRNVSARLMAFSSSVST